MTHEILEGLSANDLRGAYGNALVAHPAGILHGVDYQHTGRVERVDTTLLQCAAGARHRPGDPADRLRRRGQHLSAQLRRRRRRSGPGAAGGQADLFDDLRGDPSGPTELLRHLSMEEAEAILKKHRAEVPPEMVSKLEQAVRALRDGVPRVHIIDGRVEEGLLAEVFSNEGIGTLVHANEYQAIRRAHKRDARAIFALIQPSMASDELVRRTRGDIERPIADFFVLRGGSQPGRLCRPARIPRRTDDRAGMRLRRAEVRKPGLSAYD